MLWLLIIPAVLAAVITVSACAISGEISQMEEEQEYVEYLNAVKPKGKIV